MDFNFKLFNIICLMFLALKLDKVHGEELSDDTKETIIQGTEVISSVGDVLNSVFAEGDFKKQLKLLGTRLGPSLMFVGPLIGFMVSFWDSESDELRHMREIYSDMNSKLSHLSAKIDSINSQVQWSVSRGNLRQSEDDIRRMAHQLQRLTEVPNVAERRKVFVAKCDQYGDSVLNVYQAIKGGTNVFADKLLDLAMKSSRNNRRYIQKLSIALFALLGQGFQIEVACESARGSIDNSEYLANISKGYLETVQKIMAQADTEVQRRWEEQYKEDIKHLAAQDNTNDLEAFSEKVLKFLEDKYYWRKWFVLVYPGSAEGRYDKHFILQERRYNCRTHVIYNIFKKNVVVSSEESIVPKKVGFSSRHHRLAGCYGLRRRLPWARDLASEMHEPNNRCLTAVISTKWKIAVRATKDIKYKHFIEKIRMPNKCFFRFLRGYHQFNIIMT